MVKCILQGRRMVFNIILIFLSLSCSAQFGLYPLNIGTGTGSAYTPPTANLAAKYDAEVGVSTSGSNVTTFTDGSGNSRTQTVKSSAGTVTIVGSSPNKYIDYTSGYSTSSNFSLVQPCTIYLAISFENFIAFSCAVDGLSYATMAILDNATTPDVTQYAGSAGGNNSGATLSTWVVIAVVFNTTSSSVMVNNNTPGTGSVGSGNGGGITIGACGGGLTPLHIKFKYGLFYTAAHDLTTRQNITTWIRTFKGI